MGLDSFVYATTRQELRRFPVIEDDGPDELYDRYEGQIAEWIMETREQPRMTPMEEAAHRERLSAQGLDQEEAGLEIEDLRLNHHRSPREQREYERETVRILAAQGWRREQIVHGDPFKLDVHRAVTRDIQQLKSFCWRYHPDLHGWMNELYRRRGGVNFILPSCGEDCEIEPGAEQPTPCFCGEYLQLTPQDMADFQQDVRLGRLPRTHGCCFGESGANRRQEDLEFIPLALWALAEGKVLFYQGSW